MLKWFAAMLVALAPLSPPVAAQPADDFVVIAHRGASGERPEHTLAAYERAIDQGADYIEPDLVVTQDGVLVARHENEISGTTDVAERSEFAGRRTTKTVDGEDVTGWFAEDFTLAELRRLRARERLPEIRPANARFDGLYPVPTFTEILALVRAKEAETGRRIGLYPELKHPAFLLEQGHDTVILLVEALREADLADADDPVFVQSFEIAPLMRLDALIETPLVQLLAGRGGPADRPDLDYAEMVSASGLVRIAEYADAIGADIALLLGANGSPTSVTGAAHDAGLRVHAWTVRKENAFLPAAFRRPGGMGDEGCDDELYGALAEAGVDGVFTDNPVRISGLRHPVANGWCASDRPMDLKP